MNNGVENQETTAPLITTIDPTAVQVTEPVTVPVVVPNTMPVEANVEAPTFNSAPTPVSPEAVNNTINNIPAPPVVPATTPVVIEETGAAGTAGATESMESVGVGLALGW